MGTTGISPNKTFDSFSARPKGFDIMQQVDDSFYFKTSEGE